MKRLPVILATSHALLVVVIYSFVVSDMNRYGTLPILLFFLDFPISLISESAAPVVNAIDNSIDYKCLHVIAGAAYFVTGTIWFFLIGKFIQYVGKLIKE
jgi:hypothetical protein